MVGPLHTATRHEPHPQPHPQPAYPVIVEEVFLQGLSGSIHLLTIFLIFATVVVAIMSLPCYREVEVRSEVRGQDEVTYVGGTSNRNLQFNRQVQMTRQFLLKQDDVPAWHWEQHWRGTTERQEDEQVSMRRQVV